ncbi:hypothetical protein F4677DRAFT_431962 [Hypoxylon crocopeplum]|nr:hypothetical protein F4677DRAFT_431962 [Hypoxylon crocopeplum]
MQFRLLRAGYQMYGQTLLPFLSFASGLLVYWGWVYVCKGMYRYVFVRGCGLVCMPRQCRYAGKWVWVADLVRLVSAGGLSSAPLPPPPPPSPLGRTNEPSTKDDSLWIFALSIPPILLAWLRVLEDSCLESGCYLMSLLQSVTVGLGVSLFYFFLVFFSFSFIYFHFLGLGISLWTVEGDPVCRFPPRFASLSGAFSKWSEATTEKFFFSFSLTRLLAA